MRPYNKKLGRNFDLILGIEIEKSIDVELAKEVKYGQN